VPADVRSYPRVHYRGADAYLVNGRWYYAAPQGWVVFREEPRELARYRTELTTPRLEIGGYVVDRARSVPVDIRSRPSAPFRGAQAYYVDGRWYYPSAQGWVVFRDEPRELGRWRREIRDRRERIRPPPPAYAYPPPR
jgi:hypothetical protein